MGGEGLELLDGVARRELEEGADYVEALVVGEVGGRLAVAGFAVEVLDMSVGVAGCGSPRFAPGGRWGFQCVRVRRKCR